MGLGLLLAAAFRACHNQLLPWLVAASTSPPARPPLPAPPQREDIERMFKEVVDKWGKVDVLVNNAVGAVGCLC